MQRAVMIDVDLAVVGAGGAGLYAALTAADAGARVALVSATPLAESSSYWAQGGLAASLAVDDSPERHLEDTLRTGRGTVRRSAAEVLTHEAPAIVRDLERLGVHFDADRRGRLSLGLEGGHSVRRIAHAGGAATGRRVSRQLSALAAAHERIDVLEDCRATAVLDRDGRAAGLRCHDGRLVVARAVVLATGGAAALWARTTNPVGSTGSGMLLAHRAGAALADLEMVQFHPTAVVDPVVADNGGRHQPRRGIDAFLVTEAVRGEGALLLDAAGERFVDELSPRDEVARAVARKMQETGAASVGLDMRAVDPALFPNVVSVLRRAGIDPTRELVPVAPAAHYMMGGIATDLDECACTGLHGANRLASNSLSECFVFGRRAALAALDEPRLTGVPEPPPSSPPPPLTADSRTALWRDAGIERDAEGLRGLLDDAHPLVRLLAASALAREESRGAHQRRDFPAPDPALDEHHTVVAGDDSPALVSWR
jgi:L-aspartate oxidase